MVNCSVMPSGLPRQDVNECQTASTMPAVQNFDVCETVSTTIIQLTATKANRIIKMLFTLCDLKEISLLSTFVYGDITGLVRQ